MNPYQQLLDTKVRTQHHVDSLTHQLSEFDSALVMIFGKNATNLSFAQKLKAVEILSRIHEATQHPQPPTSL